MQLIIETTDFTVEPDDFAVVQHQRLVIDPVDVQVEIPDLAAIWHVLLSIDPVDAQIEIDDVLITRHHPLAIENLDSPHEIPDLTIVVRHALAIDPVDVRPEIPDLEARIKVFLQINDLDIYFQIPELWLWLPSGCVGYDSTRETISGLQIDAQAEFPTTEEWWSEDLYRFTIKWDSVTQEVARALSGFFAAYKNSEFVLGWPPDATQYVCILINDPVINQKSHSDDWSVELVCIGSMLGPVALAGVRSAGLPELLRLPT